ncbi:hypothetical protein LFM09_15335 [Lentzea alba]|uniref:hypothetical protein n=1 Tax=Lentzea alba TaxID=2714351 RepID=UPI0039BF2DD6
MTNPVFDPQQQPADNPVQQQFEVHTPEFVLPVQQQMPPPVAPLAPKPKRTGVVILAVFTVLMFGAAGAFGALFFLEKKHSTELSTEIDGKNREITDLGKQAKDSKDDATKALNAQKTAEAAQKRAEESAVSSQKCNDAARALRAAAIANDEAKGEAAGREIFTHC